MPTITILGALVTLVVSIFLILRKTPPAYGMMIGALIGALVGGADLVQSVTLMIDGAKGMMSAVLRILAAGVLAGVLIETGAAKSIAKTLVNKMGETFALVSLALTTMILTAVGVFIDVAVITVSPIALAIALKANLSRPAILLAMIGGGKSGNIISANPNAIAASDAFNIPLTSLMGASFIPALFGLLATVLLVLVLKKNKSDMVSINEITLDDENEKLPSFFLSLIAPVVAIGCLALRPIFNIIIDPMIALPLGALVGAVVMGKANNIKDYATFGLGKMSGVAIMLIGTGTLAGVLTNSELKTVLTNSLQALSLPSYVLAPLSGIFMSFATASTTAGTTVASGVFGSTLLDLGVGALASAVMIQAGATVLDHMPHGSFFHATGGAVNMDIKNRLKVIPYESLVGLVLTIVSTIMYGILNIGA